MRNPKTMTVEEKARAFDEAFNVCRNYANEARQYRGLLAPLRFIESWRCIVAHVLGLTIKDWNKYHNNEDV